MPNPQKIECNEHLDQPAGRCRRRPLVDVSYLTSRDFALRVFMQAKQYQADRRKSQLWLAYSAKRKQVALASLEEAARSRDSQEFLVGVRQMNWEQVEAKDFSRAIKSAMRIGLPLAARHISSFGAQYHPHNPEIRDYARLLAPASAKVINRPATSDQSPNIAWLKIHGAEYKGLWVALKDGRLLGADHALKSLVEKIADRTGVMFTPAY
jgi:hypothetical protein